MNRTCTGLKAALNLAASDDERIPNRRAWETGLATLQDAEQSRNVILSEAAVRQIIAKARNMAVRIERGLLELDIGKWTGMALRDAGSKPEWKAVQQHPSGFRFPDGESFTEMQTRITGAIARMVARHAGRIVVAVSHADPIKAAVAHALGTPLDLFQRIMIGTASISAIAYSPSGAAVLTVNSMDGDLAALGIK